MPTQSSVLQRTRLGVQSGLGNPAAANRRFPSLMSSGWLMSEVSSYAAQGEVVDGTAILNKEWSGLKYDGAGTYNELAYIFSSILGKADGGGPTGGVWTFHPQLDVADTQVFYTLEHGMDDTCGKSTDCIFNATTFAWTRDALKVSGTGFGRLYQAGVSPTANPTRIGNVPMAANQISLSYGSTYPATTVLRSAYTWDLSMTNRWGMDWVLDSTLTSWKDTLVLKPTIEMKMKLQRNSDSDAFITQMRANQTKFLSIGAIGPTGYSMNINMPFHAQAVSEPSDLAGAYVCEWTLKPIADASFLAAANNAFMEVILQNTVSAL